MNAVKTTKLAIGVRASKNLQRENYCSNRILREPDCRNICRSPRVYAQLEHETVATVTECIIDVDRMKITRTIIVDKLNVRE